MLALSANAKVAAQEGQGKYITEATVRLIKLVDAGNKDGFLLKDNSFSIGGGWLKQSQNEWVALFTLDLTAGRTYRFLGAGDNDAKDVDLQIVDASGKQVAVDDAVKAEAIVNFTPETTGRLHDPHSAFRLEPKPALRLPRHRDGKEIATLRTESANRRGRTRVVFSGVDSLGSSPPPLSRKERGDFCRSP